MSTALSLFDWSPDRRVVQPKVESRPGLSLRPYQQEADAAIDRELARVRATLAVMATGTGKTVLFAHQAAKRGGALVVAHRDSLIRQAAKKLRSQVGERVAIEKAGEYAWPGADFIVGSIQTLRGPRLEMFKRRHPDIRTIIFDEAHRSVAPGYLALAAAYPEAKIIGVTATADRADGVAMGNLYDSVAFRYEIGAATEDGWLTPIKMVPVKCSASLDGIKLRGKGEVRDFDQQQLEDAIADLAADNARGLLDVCGDHRLIVFTPGVKTAHATAQALNKLRPGTAIAVDGEMDDQQKDSAVRAHQNGDARYLVNCGVYTEGYDDETLDGIFDSAPTKSRIRAVQKWGRATRIWPHGIGHLETPAERRAAIADSPKPWAMLYDLTLNTEKHDLVSFADDLLAGKATPDEIKAVRKKLRERGGTADEALEEVRASAARAAAAAKQRKAKAGKAKTIWDLIKERRSHAEVEPRLIRPEDRPPVWAWDWMRRNGMRPPTDLTKREFQKLYREAKGRKAKGLCDHQTIERLGRYAIDGRQLSAETANRVLNAIAANRQQPLARDHLASLLAREPGVDA